MKGGILFVRIIYVEFEYKAIWARSSVDLCEIHTINFNFNEIDDDDDDKNNH